MGQKNDLTKKEQNDIVKYLGLKYNTLKISKILSRDHRTIKKFVFNGLNRLFFT